MEVNRQAMYFDCTWTLFKRKWDAIVTLHGVNAELYVSRFVTGLECPSHLAVIVGDDAISCQDFTNIIVWCLAAGISFLTVYDHKGIVLEQEARFYKYLVANTKLSNKSVIFRNLQPEQKCSNGFKQKLHVNVLCEADGADAFMQIVKHLSQDGFSAGEFDSSVDQERVRQEILIRRQCPSPELAIVASPYMSTYGYPPWDIRLTEFLRINSLTGINAIEFCQVLHRYAQCQKRVGK